MAQDRVPLAFATLALLAAAGRLYAGDLQVTVLDGGLQRPGGVKGATVTLEDTAHTATTDLAGKASIASISSGRYVLRVSGPAGFETVRLRVDVATVGTTTVTPLLLPRIPTGIAAVVTTSSGLVVTTTQVESTLVPDARLSVTSGTAITGAAGSTPKLAIYPVDRALTPTPFPGEPTPALLPGELEPHRLYAISPGGLGFSPGLHVRLPNDLRLAAGATADVFGLLPDPTRAGPGWVRLGTATVDGSTNFLASDTAFVTSATLLAVHASGALPTTYRVAVQDRAGNPVSSATVQVHRLRLTETSTAGTYEGQDVVAVGAPVRALVTKDFGNGLELHALTDPVFVTSHLTLLHRGAPLQLAVTATEGVPTAAGVVRNQTTSSGSYLLTELVTEHYGERGEGSHEAWSSELPLTFFGSVAPLATFTHSPSGTVSAPDTAPILSFTLALNDIAFDPDSVDPYTTTALVTSASFSLDGGSSYQTAELPRELGDARGPVQAPPGGSSFAYGWDLWALPAPTGITGAAQEVLLRVSVLDAPGGNEVTVDAPAFRYQWPAASVQRTYPQDKATSVFTDTQLLVDFAHAMDSSTINSTNITLSQAGVGTITSTTVTYLSASRQARITVAGQLPSNNTLTLTVTTGVENAFGLALASAKTATFSTTSITALGDDDLDGLLNAEELALGLLPGDADTDNDGLNDGDELFVYGTSPDEDDSDGDTILDGSDPSPLGSPTSPLPVADAAPVATFVVTGIAPLGSAVPVTTKLSVTFNNPFDPSTVSLGTNVVLNPGNVSLTVETSSVSSRTLYLRQTSGTLAANTTYTLTVSSGGSGVKDYDENTLAANVVATFRTGSPAAPLFEPRHYLSTLAITRWERFPLTAPTANGREGVALVIPSTHKLLLTETDVSTPGRGLDVAITRIYRNNEAASVNTSCFGNQWFFPLERRFDVIASVDTDTTVDLRHRCDDGRVFDYLSAGAVAFAFHDYKNPPGFYDNKSGTYDNLRQETDGGTTYLVQRERDGTKSYYRFYRGSSAVSPSSIQAGDVGYLEKIKDRNLNTVTITRFSGSHADRPFRIDTITDDLGRVTVFEYSTTTGQKDLVTKVEQFQGNALRSWLYTYDSSRNLTKVETPPATWKNEAGNVVTNTRKQREYTYSLSSNGVQNLTSVEDGRENVSMRFFYDSNDDVTQVDHGSGTDAGTAIYSYAVTGTLTKATQVDRNGNVLTLEHEDTKTTTLHSPSAVAYQNLSQANQLTQGVHPGMPGGEPSQLQTQFLHDSDSDLIQCTLPSGDEYVWIRGGCGCPDQEIFRAGGDPYNAIVWEFKFDPAFKNLTSLVDPRGSDPDLVAFGETPQLEDVEAQTKRTLLEAVPTWRDWFTTFFYYDHEDVAARAEADRTRFGGSPVTAWFQGVTMPASYGDDSGGGNLHKPQTSIFDPDGDGRADRGGNPVAVRGPRPEYVNPSTCALVTSPRQVIESFASFNQYGQRAFSLEPDGTWNRTEFYTSGAMKGYLKRVELDTNWRDTDSGFTVADGTTSGSPALSNKKSLATTFEYDAFGNRTLVTNARGHAWQTQFDLLNLPTKTIAPTPFLYEREMVYDGNNNLVELSVQNVAPNDLDDDGHQDDGTEQREDAAHPDFVHKTAFNTANMLVQAERDAWDGSVNLLVTTYQYDRKQLRTGVREPEGNSHWTRYDERDLPYETVEAASDPSAREVTHYDYTKNGTLARVVDDDGNLVAAMTITYDDFDRPLTWTDELGNVVEVVYDRAGLVTQRKVKGQAQSRADAPTTWLENTLTRYDTAGRPFQVARELFDVNTGETLADLGGVGSLTPAVAETALNGGEFVYELRSFNGDSNLIHVCDDNGHHTEFEYDALDRLITETDDLKSSRAYAYDAASNVIRLTESDWRPDTGMLDSVYYTETFYDALDRPFATVSHLGNTRRAMYDSRGNVVQTSDAMGLVSSLAINDLPTTSEHGSFPQLTAGTSPSAVTTINARGNTTRFQYDGLSRLVRTERDLRQDGTGSSIVTGQIVTQTVWDGNSRVLSRIDPAGNATRYAYDHQNRQILELFADGTQHRTTWNAVDTVALEVDARGTAKSYTYDAAERRSDMAVTGLPLGAGQTTFAAWDFDGLGRRTKAEDDDSIVETDHDSLSRVVEEIQTVGTGTPRTAKNQSLSPALTGTLKRAYDGVGNLIKQTYPSTQVYERRYDDVDRLATLKTGWNGTTEASFTHVGMGTRRLVRDYTPGGGAALRQATEYDGERRVISLEAYHSETNTRIRGFGYAWDRANNRRWERRLTSVSLHDEFTGTGEAYRYDSAYRLVHDDKDVADASLDAIGTNLTSVPVAPFVSANASDYVLDAAGNRRQTTIAGVTAGYSLEVGAPSQDAAMNQYTVIGSAVRSHDPVGNLISSSDTGRQAFFDAENRLVQWTEGTKDIRYRYDADGRRILKQDVQGSPTFAPTITFWDGWQEVQEYVYSGSWSLNKTFVFGEGIDEVLKATLPDAADIDNDSNTSEPVDLWYHHNSLGSVVAVTNASGVVKESYRYSAYGQVSIFDKNGDATSTTQVKQPFMFTGRRLDFEEGSGLYYYRLRYYDPAVGRFVSRDPLGMWGDPAQNGNGESYCGDDPTNVIDPYGLNAIEDLLKKWGIDAGKLKSDDYLRTRSAEDLKEIEKALKDTHGRDWKKTDEARRLKKVQKAKGIRASSVRRGGGSSGRAGRVSVAGLAGTLVVAIGVWLIEYAIEQSLQQMEDEAIEDEAECEALADDLDEICDELEKERTEREAKEQGGTPSPPSAPTSPPPASPPSGFPSGSPPIFGFPQTGGRIELP